MTRKILLTGGAGDLAKVLAKTLVERGDTPVRLDIRPPGDQLGVYHQGSILDRAALADSLAGVEQVVHIAAWHGIHEVTGQKNVYDFWDLNVTGTFYVFEAAAQAGIEQIIYISSTSIEERFGLYGHTKVLGEEIAQTYAVRHGLQVITLRPRAFIPYWNRAVYDSFAAWAKWFWPGAVHIDDVGQAVIKSLDLLAGRRFEQSLTLTVDGAYDYSAEDLANWDSAGPGTTFKKYYPDEVELARRYGLEPAQQPVKLDISATKQWLGYNPTYSHKNLLLDLDRYGAAGPPPPTF